jgi:hypothetical protein
MALCNPYIYRGSRQGSGVRGQGSGEDTENHRGEWSEKKKLKKVLTEKGCLINWVKM